MIAALFLDIVLLAGVSALGLLAARLILRSAHGLDLISLALPLGMGTFTWSLFVISWAGISLTWQVVAALLALLLLAVAILSLGLSPGQILRQHLIDRGRLDLSFPSLLSRSPIIAFSLIIVTATVIAVGIGYSAWDAIAIWSIKGYGIAQTGSVLEAQNWGAHRSAYPLNVSLLISAFRLLGGDQLPGSKAVFPLLWASTLVGIYAFWRRQRVSRVFSGLGILFLASVPIMFLHGTIGYANIPLASYIVLGALWGTLGIVQDDKRAQIMSGILLGLGAWTRVEGILFSLSIVLALVVAWLISRRGKLHLGAWLLPFLVIAGVWLAFFRMFGAEGSQASGALGEAFRAIPAGEFGLNALIVIGRYFIGRSIDWGLWGLLFPVGLGLILVNLRKLTPKEHPTSFTLLLCTLLTGAATVALYYIGSYISPDLGGWLSRSFPRAFFQSAFLIGTLAILVLSSSLGGIADSEGNSGKAKIQVQS